MNFKQQMHLSVLSIFAFCNMLMLLELDALAIEHLSIYGWILRGAVWLMIAVSAVTSYEAFRRLLADAYKQVAA